MDHAGHLADVAAELIPVGQAADGPGGGHVAEDRRRETTFEAHDAEAVTNVIAHAQIVQSAAHVREVRQRSRGRDEQGLAQHVEVHLNLIAKVLRRDGAGVIRHIAGRRDVERGRGCARRHRHRRRDRDERTGIGQVHHQATGRGRSLQRERGHTGVAAHHRVRHGRKGVEDVRLDFELPHPAPKRTGGQLAGHAVDHELVDSYSRQAARSGDIRPSGTAILGHPHADVHGDVPGVARVVRVADDGVRRDVREAIAHRRPDRSGRINVGAAVDVLRARAGERHHHVLLVGGVERNLCYHAVGQAVGLTLTVDAREAHTEVGAHFDAAVTTHENAVRVTRRDCD